MDMLKDSQKFEKYYLHWYKKHNNIEDPVPSCVKRLVNDSNQRKDRGIRDELMKQERERHELEEAMMLSTQLKTNTIKNGQVRTISKFLED